MEDEEPQVKRPRLASPAAAAAALAGEAAADAAASRAAEEQGPLINSLFLVPAGLPREPSPGAMHGCRIAAHAPAGTGGSGVEVAAAFASGPQVYWSQLSLGRRPMPEQGKEGILLPVRLSAPPATALLALRCVAEVQSLALHALAGQPEQPLLAYVDAFGDGGVTRLQLSAAAGGGEDGAPAAAAPPAVAAQARLRPADACREAGWAGVAFGAADGGGGGSGAGLLVAAARGFARDITLFDAASGDVVRTLGCALNPYALRFLPPGLAGGGSQLLAAAEGHLVSLWDARAAGAGGGCVARLAVAGVGQPLYSLEWCPAQGGLLGAAGAERSVYMSEPRKWRVLCKWGGATRLAIHSLSFLAADPRHAVLAGLDLEVLCGRWDKPGSNARPFPSVAPAGEGGSGGAAPAPAAPGAPGSGDRRRGGGGGGGGGGGANAADGAAPGVAGGGGGFSFRGDGRWLGVSRAGGADVIAGFSASGSLVYATVG